MDAVSVCVKPSYYIKKDFTSEISIDGMAALYHPTVGKSTAFARFMVFASILFAYRMVL